MTLLGVMAGPSMIRSGYDAKMSAGAISSVGPRAPRSTLSVTLIPFAPLVGALAMFVAFYLSCIAVTWWHYARPGAALPC